MSPSKPEASPERRRDNVSAPGVARALLVFTVLVSLYTFSYRGVLRVDDEHILAARTQSFALRGTFEQGQVFGNTRVQQLMLWGDQALEVEPSQAILGALFYRAGLTLGGGGMQAALLLNFFATVLAALLVFGSVSLLGFDHRVGATLALLFGMGTMAWPYALTFYRDTLAMLFTALAFMALTMVQRTHGWKRAGGLVLMLIAVIGGLLSKNTVWALVPSLLLGGMIMWQMERESRSKPWVMALALLMLALLAFVLVSRIPDQGPLARYSSSYYRYLLQHFRDSLRKGFFPAVLGPFFSPAKSILLFSPPLVLALAAIPSLRSRRMAACGMAAWSTVFWLSALQALFYRHEWAGAFGWGLRFMLPAIPALMVAAAPAVERIFAWRFPPRILAIGALFVLGVWVQAAGSLVPWRVAYRAWIERGMDPYAPASSWQSSYLVLPGQMLRLFDPRGWDMAWVRVVEGGAWAALVVPLAAITLLVLAAALILKPSEGQYAGSARLPWLLAGLALVLSWYPSLWLYRNDPRMAGDRAAFDNVSILLEDRVQSADIVVLDSYGTPLWMYMINRWTSQVPWYSLPYEIPPSGIASSFPGKSAIALLDSFGQEENPRIWLLETSEAPAFRLHRTPAWLSRSRRILWTQRFQDASGEVVLYLFAPIQSP